MKELAHAVTSMWKVPKHNTAGSTHTFVRYTITTAGATHTVVSYTTHYRLRSRHREFLHLGLLVLSA